MIISIKDKAYQHCTYKAGIKRLVIKCAGHRKQSAGPQGHPRKSLKANNISIKDTDRTAICNQLTTSSRLRKWSQVNFLLANLFITTSFQADSWKNWRSAIKKLRCVASSRSNNKPNQGRRFYIKCSTIYGSSDKRDIICSTYKFFSPKQTLLGVPVSSFVSVPIPR